MGIAKLEPGQVPVLGLKMKLADLFHAKGKFLLRKAFSSSTMNAKSCIKLRKCDAAPRKDLKICFTNSTNDIEKHYLVFLLVF